MDQNLDSNFSMAQYLIITPFCDFYHTLFLPFVIVFRLSLIGTWHYQKDHLHQNKKR